MTTEQRVYKGWMCCPVDQVHVLHNLHVKITKQISTDQYEVEITEPQLEELDRHWPEIHWSVK